MKKSKSYIFLEIFIIISFIFCLSLVSPDNNTFVQNNEIFDEDSVLRFSSERSFDQQWNSTWIGSNNDRCYGSDTDSQDDIYLVGYTSSFGAGSNDVCIPKYNRSGDNIKNITWGGTGDDGGYDIVIDSLDYVYVVGYTSSFGAGSNDICIIKLNQSGNIEWNTTWGGSNSEEANAVCLDSEENLIIGGSTTSFGSGASNVCVLKYNSTSGEQIWNTTWGSYNYETTDIVLDSSDNIYLSGVTGYSGSAARDILTLKFNNVGIIEWSRTWGGGDIESGDGIALDSNNNVYVTGYTYSYVSTNICDMVIVKYNEHGDFLDYNTWEFDLVNGGSAILIDELDIIYILGYNVGSTSYWHSIILICDTSFQPIFSDYLIFDSTDISSQHMAFDSKNNILISGFTRTSGVPNNMYLVKYYGMRAPYFININENFSMIEGDTTKTVTWDLQEDRFNYDRYWILQNGFEVKDGIWDGSQIYYNDFNELEPGIYNFTCFVNNSYGKINSTSVFVTITPNHSPLIYNVSSDNAYDIGTVGYSLEWHAHDIDGNNNTFWIERNGLTVSSGMWINDSIIEYVETNDTLPVGVYNYICYVDDTQGATNSSMISITIINHNPVITNNVENFTVNYGTTGYLLSWHAHDMDGNNNSYWIERNGIKIAEGNWNNDTDIELIEFETLIGGIYNYTCFVNDTSNSINQSSIEVKVNFYPISSNVILPSNNVYKPNADYTFNCTWSDIDGVIEEVKFEFESFNYTVMDNFSGEFSINLNDLAANENGYDFRWHARNDDGIWNSTELFNFILHKQIIQFKILFNGTEDNIFYNYNPIINITLINLNSTSGNIRLIIDDEVIQEEVGYSLINVSQYINGVYNITAVLTDDNYTGFKTSYLILSELIPPIIDFEYSEFYINNTAPEYSDTWISILCTVTDNSPITGVYLYENSSGVFINHSMNYLGNGNWSISIDIQASGIQWNDIVSFYFRANDSFGNIGINDNSTFLYSFRIDDYQNPSTILNFIPYVVPISVNKSTIFTLVAEDGLGSGISITRYRINNSIWIDYNNTPFNLIDYDFGFYNISYCSIDLENNIEEIKWIIINLIDTPSDSGINTAIPGFDLNITILIGLLGIFLFNYKFRKNRKIN